MLDVAVKKFLNLTDDELAELLMFKSEYFRYEDGIICKFKIEGVDVKIDVSISIDDLCEYMNDIMGMGVRNDSSLDADFIAGIYFENEEMIDHDFLAQKIGRMDKYEFLDEYDIEY